MITITIKNQWCYYDDDTIERFTRFSVPHYNDPLEIMVVNLKCEKQKRFPIGILFIVEKRLYASEIEYKINDLNTYEYKNVKEKYSLRYYQEEAINKVLEKKRGILKHPTGSGKTRVAICLSECIQGVTLFVVDTISLINQTATAYKELTSKTANIISSSNFELSKFNIVTLQTLYSLSKSNNLNYSLKDVTCVLFDECHILGAETYYKVAMSIPAQWRIGLSATPTNRTDSLDIYVVACTGGIIHNISMQELINANNLADPYVIFYDYSVEKYKYSKYNYKEVITTNKNRNIAILELCRIAPKPCLLFYEYREHGYLLQKNINNLGYSADLVHGLYDGFQRERAIKELINGETDILLTSRIFNKGVNIPELKSCINAAGWKAFIPTIQKLGRGTRKTKDKDKIIFFDLYDIENATSLSHSRERIQNYESEKLKVERFNDIQTIDLYIKNIL